MNRGLWRFILTDSFTFCSISEIQLLLVKQWSYKNALFILCAALTPLFLALAGPIFLDIKH